MRVRPATLHRAPDDGSTPFVPYGDARPHLIGEFDYIEEEWIATGKEDGRPYATTVFVRRPRDGAGFSGTVLVEPLHLHGIAPVWMYSSPYILRSGHGWACVASQKLALDVHTKASNPQRYESLHIDGPDSSDFDTQPPFDYYSTPVHPDGTPDVFTIGGEQPFDEVQLKELYDNATDYRERFDRRLDELIGEGWLLADDADDARD